MPKPIANFAAITVSTPLGRRSTRFCVSVGISARSERRALVKSDTFVG